jgi:transposase
MDATTLTPDSPLPDDVPSLHALVRQLLAELARLRAENAGLKAKLDSALRRRFGRSSERQRTSPQKTGKPAKARPHGRAALPEHLERRLVVHDLGEEQKLCPCCGRQRACIGEQAAEQLDVEPVKFFVRRTVRGTYACRHCDSREVPPEQRITTAGPAQVGPIAKGLCGPGLLAHAVTAKFADHTPLNRLAGQLARSGVTVARSTLGDWLAAAAALLAPLVALMRQRALLSRVIHSDDTGVKLRVPGAEQAKQTHLWTYIGDADFPYVVFDYTTGYTAEGPQKFLAGYKGYLQADALAQYEGLYSDELKHVCCAAHARRKFVAALEGGDEGARVGVELFGKLYAIERQLPALLGPSDDPGRQQQRRQLEEQRQEIRQEQAVPILGELKKWLDERKPKALPKSALGQAIGYALNNWEALKRYCERGYLAIDNNKSERALRAIALGRNNWVALGGETGGRTAAVLYSVALSCKHVGADPFAYLREALMGVFALGDEPTAEQLSEWLPDRWLARQPVAALAKAAS